MGTEHYRCDRRQMGTEHYRDRFFLSTVASFFGRLMVIFQWQSITALWTAPNHDFCDEGICVNCLLTVIT